MAIYLLSASQISIQPPLSEEWMHAPSIYHQPHCCSVDPDFHQYVTSKDFRRISKLVKRAISTSRCAVEQVPNLEVEAILTGTGVGCIESTEKFLMSILNQGESLLSPTHFIYSTHNTIGSQIAMNLQCHGYNNTYSQQGTSFDCALFDAVLQLQAHRINTALVGGFDEMSTSYFQLLDTISFWGNPQQNESCMAGESAVSMVLSNSRGGIEAPWCMLHDMVMLYRPSMHRLQEELHQLLQSNQLSIDDIDTVVVGTNGLASNDSIYASMLSLMPLSTRVVAYKSLFGEGFTMSGIGTYVAAAMLHYQFIPPTVLVRGNGNTKPRHILVYNHFQNRHHSLILLSAC